MKRVIAIAFLVVSVIASLLIGCLKASSDMKSDLEDCFRLGLNNDGFSIQSDIDIICTNANAIISVANRYQKSDAALIAGARNAYDNMKLAKSIPEKRSALTVLVDSVYELFGNLKSTAELSDADMRLIKQCEGEIQSRCITIESNGYNSEVAEYNRNMKIFPANIIAPLIGIKDAEMF